MNIKHISLTFLFILLFLFFIKAFDISYPLKITITNTSSELAVVGEGKVEAIPDTAYIDIGVTVSNVKTVEEARGKIDGINNKLIEAVKKLGISSKEIQTTNYSILPAYSYENNTNKITGYDGNATITIKTNKIESMPLIIEEAAKTGANQINDTRFVVSAPEKYREAAREQAIKNAKDQANKMAQSLGIKLGRVVNVVETINGGTTPMSILSSKMVGGGSATMEPGSETISSLVTLYFEKK